MRGFCRVGADRNRSRSVAYPDTECLTRAFPPEHPRTAVASRHMPKKYREVRTALQEAGWQVLRQRGSHEVWGQPGEDARIVVAGKASATLSRWARCLAFAAQAAWNTCDERVRSGL